MFDYLVNEKHISTCKRSWEIYSQVGRPMGSNTMDYMVSFAVSHKADLESFGKLAFAEGKGSATLYVRVAPTVFAALKCHISVDAEDTAYIESMDPWFYEDVATHYDLSEEEALRRVTVWGALLAELYTFGDYPFSETANCILELPEDFRRINKDGILAAFS